jgi:uncharacterized membrane protein YfcA
MDCRMNSESLTDAAGVTPPPRTDREILRGRKKEKQMTILAFIFAVFVLGGFVKGVVGLGLPTVTIGLLSLVMAPAEAAALLVVPSLVTNVWQFAFGPQLVALLKRLATVCIGICAGVWLGAGMLTGASSKTAVMLLGVALVLYAISGLLSVRFRVSSRAEPWLAPAIGVATGLVTAATGVFVIPLVPYLQALGLEKDDLVQALGISFTVATLALALALAKDGMLSLSVAGTSLFALVPALLGMWIGQHIRSRIQAATFRRWFFIGLLLLGLHLAVRPFV